MEAAKSAQVTTESIVKVSESLRTLHGNSTSGLFVKTRLCRFNGMGICTRGAECKFAHSRDERRPIPNLKCTKLCPQLDGCNDPSCRFAHKALELRALDIPRPALKRNPTHVSDEASEGSTEADSNSGTSQPEFNLQQQVPNVTPTLMSPPSPNFKPGQFSSQARDEKANYARTKLCKFFMLGCCAKQGTCRFAHGEKELRRPHELHPKALPKTVSSKGAEAQGRLGIHSRDLHPKERVGIQQLQQPPQPVLMNPEAALKQHLEAYALAHKQLASQWLQSLPPPVQQPQPWQAPAADLQQAQQMQQAMDQPLLGQPCFLQETMWPQVPTESDLSGQPTQVNPDAYEGAPVLLPQKALRQPVALGAQKKSQTQPLRLSQALQHDAAQDEPMWCDASQFLSIGFQGHPQQPEMQQPSASAELQILSGETHSAPMTVRLDEKACPKGDAPSMNLVELIGLLVQQKDSNGPLRNSCRQVMETPSTDSCGSSSTPSLADEYGSQSPSSGVREAK